MKKVFHQINGFSLCNHTWVQMICFLFTIGEVMTNYQYVNAVSTIPQFVHLLCEKKKKKKIMPCILVLFILFRTLTPLSLTHMWVL
jgi:accessory gene regulator protein AgrB